VAGGEQHAGQVEVVDVLGLASVSNLLGSIIAYLPNVFVAILVLLVGLLLANLCADIVSRVMANTTMGNPRIFANIADDDKSVIHGRVSLS